jgi:hypothetical protein
MGPEYKMETKDIEAGKVHLLLLFFSSHPPLCTFSSASAPPSLFQQILGGEFKK